MIGALRVKSSQKDELFVNSVLIRLIFFSLIEALGPFQTRRVKTELRNVIGVST